MIIKIQQVEGGFIVLVNKGNKPVKKVVSSPEELLALVSASIAPEDPKT